MKYNMAVIRQTAGLVFNRYPAEHDNPTFANSVDPDQMVAI